jgi:threonine dehydrogenase-like Zn-dependent dehydrogenase
VPGVGLTAYEAFTVHAPLRPGMKVLVHGAGGGVGTYAVQIARAMDAEVTAVVSAGKVDLAKKLGADHVIDYKKEDPFAIPQRFDVLFNCVRGESNFLPFSDRLIHKVRDREIFVRSKSELVIANMLVEQDIEFHYERLFESTGGNVRLPDFTFIDAAGEKIIWEHLGLLHQPAYREDWERKLKFYKSNGFNLGENLFTTADSPAGALNSDDVFKVINQIKEYL